MQGSPVSSAIQWGLNGLSSHFAIADYSYSDQGLVTHHNMLGFQIDWLPEFLKHSKVVYALQPIEKDKALFRKIRSAIGSEYADDVYDMPALAYFAGKVLQNKLLGSPIPRKNKWSRKHDPLCTGHAGVMFPIVPNWFSIPIEDFDIIPPDDLFHNMKASGMFNDVTLKWRLG